MATQAYRSRLDKTVGTNSGTAKVAHPGAPELQPKPGAENKTPAPTRAPTTTPDMARTTSWGRSDGSNGDNPGKAGYGGPSSLNPGERAGPATVNPNAQTDTVLQGLIEGGVRKLDAQDDWQTRQVDATPMPVTFGHRSRVGDSTEAVVPAKTGTMVTGGPLNLGAKPVRQP